VKKRRRRKRRRKKQRTAPNVQTAHSEVVDCASEGRTEVERATVGVDSEFGVAAVCEGRAESVPEEEVLLVKKAEKGEGREEKEEEVSEFC
jgi:hypothetical protein